VTLAGLLCAVLLLGCIQPGPAEGEAPETTADIRRAVFVGNNWEGTADIVLFDPEAGTFTHVARLDIIPDIDERMAEMLTDPERLGFFLGIRHVVGEGNDQFVDDMYSTHDGKNLIVSRPSLRDVISLEIASGEINWRFVVDGQRSDHMAISPDGRHVAVSASTGNVVHILNTTTGQEEGRFPSGDSPHENIYSKDGSLIYHASIGLVYTPLDQPILDPTKGERYFQIVDAQTNEVLHRIIMGEKLEEAGYPDMSSAVRPMTLSPDERYAYMQVSFFHGFFEYDLEEHKVLRLAHLPDNHPDRPREQYVLDSAHHGIAMDAAGTKLCVAGTMSDYAAIVDRDDFEKFTIIQKPEGARPYWSTKSDDGEHCFVSWSDLDQISAIHYETAEEIAVIDVGRHPQRVRTGYVDSEWVEQQIESQ
jgi:hypothetical protein